MTQQEIDNWNEETMQACIDQYCDTCHINKKDSHFFLQTTTFYRNKAEQYLFFCSFECLNYYENTMMCKKCHYADNLLPVHTGNESFLLCTDNPYDISCYDEYYGKTKIPCIFCNYKMIEPENIISIDYDNEYSMCSECYYVYSCFLENYFLTEFGDNCAFCCSVKHKTFVFNEKKINLCQNCSLLLLKIWIMPSIIQEDVRNFIMQLI